MLDLFGVQKTITALDWILSLGKSELIYVQSQTTSLIHELSMSLTSLWEITSDISSIPKAEFNAERFGAIYDYFYTFYLSNDNIASARTHCSNVVREVKRIKFKLGKLLHTDLGRWQEADQKLDLMQLTDGLILKEYDACLSNLYSRLQDIRFDIENNDIASGLQAYLSLKQDLEVDIEQLRLGVKKMEAALNHVQTITG